MHVERLREIGVGAVREDALDAPRCRLGGDHDDGDLARAGIGPELPQVIDDRSVNTRRFLVVPVGFVCDHTEILFDIDVQAAEIAREFATTLRRTASLNTSPLLIAMLEDLVKQQL